VDVTIDLEIDGDAAGVPGQTDMERWLAAALKAGGSRRPGGFEVGIRVVSEQESQGLNRQYRGKDRPTNVLAFPAAAAPGDWPRDVPVTLGDLVICAAVVDREAAEQGKAPAAHWAHMLVHGMLHLLGHDHQTESEAGRMESLEIRVLQAGGLENPYEDRYPT